MPKTAREKSGGSTLVRARRLFAEYAKHWGMILLTISMVILGSSLRGKWGRSPSLKLYPTAFRACSFEPVKHTVIYTCLSQRCIEPRCTLNLTPSAARNVPLCSLAGDIIFVAVLAYKSYLANFQQGSLDKQNINTTTDYDSNQTVTLTVARSSDGEPMYSYEPLLPDYLQILPDEWNMKDLLFYIAMGIGSSQLIFQVS